MKTLDLTSLSPQQQPLGHWAAALTLALARDEVAGRRPPRLTETRLDTWSRFRGRLSSADFLALLFEDAAVLHPIPFDPLALGAPSFRMDSLPESLADSWLSDLARWPLDADGAEYLLDQARLLSLPSRLARADLHVVKPHQRVLELPGTAGQLAHHLVLAQGDLNLQDNFTVACGSWQELTLAGIVGLDLGAPHTGFAYPASAADLRSAEHPLRQRSFDFVIGLHPDKGGLLRFEDELAIYFPSAKVLLV